MSSISDKASKVWLYLACLPLVTLGLGCHPKSAEKKAADKKQTTAASALKNVEAPTLKRPIAVGEQVFDFSALAHTGQRFKLSEFLSKPVLVYFCPQVAAPACTEIALSIKAEWLNLRPHLSMVFGVSPEPSIVLREFYSEHELPHLLVSDTKGSVRKVMGQPVGVISSYLIGTDRKILKVFQPPNTSQHATEVLAALRELGLLRPIPPE